MNEIKVEIDKLKIDTCLLIETKNNVYEIIIVDTDGSIMISGGVIFLEKTPALLVGCESNKGLLVRNKRVELVYEQDGRTTHIQTSPLLSCNITYGDWNYEVWPGFNDSLEPHK